MVPRLSSMLCTFIPVNTKQQQLLHIECLFVFDNKSGKLTKIVWERSYSARYFRLKNSGIDELPYNYHYFLDATPNAHS